MWTTEKEFFPAVNENVKFIRDSEGSRSVLRAIQNNQGAGNESISSDVSVIPFDPCTGKYIL